MPVTAEEGETVEGRYTITSIVQQGASGLGIYIQSPDGEFSYDDVDPYNGADDIIDFCAAQSTTTTPETTVPDTSAPDTTPPPTTAPATNRPPVTPPAATPVVRDPDLTG